MRAAKHPKISVLSTVCTCELEIRNISNVMKKTILRFLIRHGIVGVTCSKYRVSLRGNGQLTVERYYRFRWRPLNVVMGKPLWGKKKGMLAYLPDAGQLKDGILEANARAERVRLSRRTVSRYILDADDLGRTVPLPGAETSAVPPVLRRATEQ